MEFGGEWKQRSCKGRKKTSHNERFLKSKTSIDFRRWYRGQHETSRIEQGKPKHTYMVPAPTIPLIKETSDGE